MKWSRPIRETYPQSLIILRAPRRARFARGVFKKTSIRFAGRFAGEIRPGLRLAAVFVKSVDFLNTRCIVEGARPKENAGGDTCPSFDRQAGN